MSLGKKFLEIDNFICKNSGQFLQVYLELMLEKLYVALFNSTIHINQSATEILYIANLLH